MHHPQWRGTTAQAKELQNSLRSQIQLQPLNRPIRYIAGADVSLNRFGKTGYAGLVVLDYQTLEPVESQGHIGELTFPYIPGYLSFREVPLLLAAWQKLNARPDAVMLDGHGIAHPRQMGVATHFGLAAGVATLGCAKKPLVGEFQEPGAAVLSTEPMSVNGEIRGFALRSKQRCKTIFASPGTGMNCDDALAITRHCLRGYRLPEPTRLAHLYVNELRTMDFAGD